MRRFALTHRVPALRDRESASVDHYRRLFTRHLRERAIGGPDADLRAAVVGASVVAAHNVALREWLAAGAPADGVPGLVARFRSVAALLPATRRSPPSPTGSRPPSAGWSAGSDNGSPRGPHRRLAEPRRTDVAALIREHAPGLEPGGAGRARHRGRRLGPATPPTPDVRDPRAAPSAQAELDGLGPGDHG